MFKKVNYIVGVLVLLFGTSVNAQVTTQSPYSRYGIGNIKSMALPQFKAMGGISTAVYSPTGYSNINMMNPASFAGINLTTVDIGASAHVALAFPVTTRSALSFGLLPYSELGYQFVNRGTLTAPGSTASQDVNYIYAGEGGLNKAYFGYGYQFGKHLRLGANVEYIFGNLLQTRSTELVDQTNAINSRLETKNSVGGVSYSYGAQYNIPLNSKTSVTLGYSGSSSSSINSTKSFVVTQYLKDATTGNELSAMDSLVNTQNSKTKYTASVSPFRSTTNG
jgi:hypothetical protein